MGGSNTCGTVSYLGTTSLYELERQERINREAYELKADQRGNYLRISTPSYRAEPVKLHEEEKLKVKKHRMPRLIRLSLYSALVYMVWKLVLNIDAISMFIINLFINHAK